MRLNIFKSGLIDEIACIDSAVSIEKVGLTKYRFKALGPEEIDFELWTTKKGKVNFDLDLSEKGKWLSAELNDLDLNTLTTEKCSFHFEHCDRGAYSISFTKGKEIVRGSISTNGYLKTKLSTSDAKNS